MILREPFKNRTKVSQHKVGEGSAVNAAPTGRTGKRRRKEIYMSAEEKGCRVKTEDTPQSLAF